MRGSVLGSAGELLCYRKGNVKYCRLHSAALQRISGGSSVLLLGFVVKGRRNPTTVARANRSHEDLLGSCPQPVECKAGCLDQVPDPGLSEMTESRKNRVYLSGHNPAPTRNQAEGIQKLARSHPETRQKPAQQYSTVSYCTGPLRVGETEQVIRTN